MNEQWNLVQYRSRNTLVEIVGSVDIWWRAETAGKRQGEERSRKQITQFRGFCVAGKSLYKRKEELEGKESLQPRQKSTLPARRTVTLFMIWDSIYSLSRNDPITGRRGRKRTTCRRHDVVRQCKRRYHRSPEGVTEKKLNSFVAKLSVPVYSRIHPAAHNQPSRNVLKTNHHPKTRGP